MKTSEGIPAAQEVHPLEQVFRSQIDAYGEGDVGRLLAHFTEDCVLTDMSKPHEPFEGKAAIKGFLDDYFADFLDCEPQILSLTYTDKLVMGELLVSARYVAEPFSPSNSRQVSLRYCLVDEVNDGLICAERFYWDTAEFERQLRI